jgi:hypothetical protein
VYSVKTWLRIRPPITVTPSGWRSEAPWPMPMASGTAPSTAAKVVIMIGRRRTTAASWIALRASMPALRCNWIATSTIMMPFFFTIPISKMMPIIAMTENGVPKISMASVAPMPAEGSVERIVSGWMVFS